MKTIKYFNNLEFDYYESSCSKNILYIFIHGGGLVESDKNEIYEIAPYFLEEGIEIASINYSLYPNVKYPAFIKECALAIKEIIKLYPNRKYVLGGISAGGFIAMSLAFNKSFLNEVDLDPTIFKGFIFDAGQSTQHFRINEDLGLPTWSQEITPIAPLYYLDNLQINKSSKILIFAAENDLPNRLQENNFLANELKRRDFDVTFIEMMGYSHCMYKQDKGYINAIISLFNNI